MSKEARYDPEVLELLEEAVRDPDSILFRVPATSDWSSASELPVGEAMSLRERHLATAHRDTVGHLLGQVARERLMEPPIEKSLTHRVAEFDSVGLHETIAALQHPKSQAFPEETALLEGSKASASRLALASLRLSPRDETRVVLASALLAEGRWQGSLALNRDLLSGESSKSTRAFALAQLSTIAYLRARPRRALGYYLEASGLTPADPLPAAYGMTTAILLGEDALALEASERLMDAGWTSAFEQEVLAVLKSTKGRGLLKATRQAEERWPRTRDRLPEATQEMAHAVW